MAPVFVIEDEFHAEWHGRYVSFRDAMQELKRRAELPWDQSPNRCPCASWKTCQRDYQILEYDDSTTPWRLVRKLGYLHISNVQAIWSDVLADENLTDGEYSG